MNLLDLKSHYSIKQAYGSPEKLVERAKALGCKSVALTDYNSISGCINFYESAKKADIKPILGCTFSLRNSGRITVLAKNLEGWKALIKLVSLSYTKEFYDEVNERPYLTLDKLKEFGTNLIFIIGAPGDLIHTTIFEKPSQHLKRTDILENIVVDPLLELVAVYDSLKFFSTYVGLSPNGTDYTHWFNEVVRDSGLPSVILSNAHYPSEDDHLYFKLLLCSKLKTTRSKFEKVALEQEAELLRYKENQWFVRGDLEGFTEEEIKRTDELAESIETYEVLHAPKLPKFQTPNGQSDHEYLKELCREGWRKKLIPSGKVDKEEDKKVYLDRVNEELSVFTENNLSSYFLIVSDFIEFIYKNGWRTSPGRGCLSGDTNVYTSSGYKQLEDVNINDYVITNSGEYNKVLNKFEYDVNEELIRLQVYFGDFKGLTLTKEHKCLAIKRKKWSNGRDFYAPFEYEPQWFPADELQTGDLLCQTKIKTVDENIEFDLTKYTFRQKNGTKAYIEGDKIIYYKTGNQHSPGQYLQCPLSLKLDENLAYALGVFTGDGWFFSHSEKANTIGFCFHSINNLESQNKIDSYMLSIGCKPNYTFGQNGKLVNQIHYTNGVIGQLFRTLFPDYNYKPDSKCVPDCIFKCSKNIIMSYLMGLINSDGSISQGRITICTISKKLVYQIKQLGLMVGLPVAVRTELRGDKREEFKNRKRAYYAGMPNFLDDNRRQYYFEDDKYIYTGIRKKETVTEYNKVYDIEVENEHNYLTSSGIVHNSVGGCLVAYLTNITKIDPIEYKLFFSRFFNSSRKGSMPDIDVDMPVNHREEVIEYVRNKYGRDRVGNLATFGEMKGATAIKEVLRINDVCGFDQMNEITKCVPEESKIADEMENTGEESILLFTLKYRPEKLQDWVRYNKETDKLEGDYANWFEQAIKLEGTIQSTGKHASALVVFEEPLSNVCPMINDKSGDEPMVGFDMKSSEKVGLTKLDFLSLQNLDKILEVNNILKERASYYRGLAKVISTVS